MNTMFMLAYSAILDTAYNGFSEAITCHVFVYKGWVTPSAVSMLVMPKIIAGMIAEIARKI